MMTAEIVVVLLGLVLLGAFVWQVLFTPMKEERLAAHGATRRESSSPECYHLRGLRFLRQPRDR